MKQSQTLLVQFSELLFIYIRTANKIEGYNTIIKVKQEDMTENIHVPKFNYLQQ